MGPYFHSEYPASIGERSSSTRQPTVSFSSGGLPCFLNGLYQRAVQKLVHVSVPWVLLTILRKRWLTLLSPVFQMAGDLLKPIQHCTLECFKDCVICLSANFETFNVEHLSTSFSLIGDIPVSECVSIFPGSGDGAFRSISGEPLVAG